MVICLEQGANDLHIVQLMPLVPHHLLLIKIQNDLNFLVQAYPDCPGKEAIKWVSVVTNNNPLICIKSVFIVLWICF